MLKTVLLLLWFLPVSAQAPDSTGRQSAVLYYKAQFAGNIGLVSAGAGYIFPARRVLADLSIGYLPKHINGVRVFTLSAKPAYTIMEGTRQNLNAGWYIGTAINYGWGRNIFGSMPDYYPLDYYWPNAFHFNPFTGLRLNLNSPGRKNRTYLYAELGTVDYEIWFAAKNRKVSLPDIVNLAVGIMVSPNRTRTK